MPALEGFGEFAIVVTDPLGTETVGDAFLIDGRQPDLLITVVSAL